MKKIIFFLKYAKLLTRLKKYKLFIPKLPNEE